MCHIYIYTHAHTDTDTHTFSCRPHSLLSCCAWEPLSVKASTATATARQRAHTLTHTHTHLKTHMHKHKNHARIFLAIVQPFYSSKPYHKSLHSCSLSISISHTQTQTQTPGFSVYCSDCFPRTLSRSSAEKIEVRVIREALFSPNPLIPFVGFKTFSEL